MPETLQNSYAAFAGKTLPRMRSSASPTVAQASLSSSGIEMSRASSKRIASSTMSSESAPRSEAKLASSRTAPMSTARWSAISDRAASTSRIFFLPYRTCDFERDYSRTPTLDPKYENVASAKLMLRCESSSQMPRILHLDVKSDLYPEAQEYRASLRAIRRSRSRNWTDPYLWTVAPTPRRRDSAPKRA